MSGILSWIFERIAGWIGVEAAMIIMVVVALKTGLSALSKGLEVIKDKTETDIDNKIYKIVRKVIIALQKILDIVGFNPKHK